MPGIGNNHIEWKVGSTYIELVQLGWGCLTLGHLNGYLTFSPNELLVLVVKYLLLNVVAFMLHTNRCFGLVMDEGKVLLN